MSHWNASIYDNSFKFVSEYGKELIELLRPQKGELILDLGCGTGDLTNQIALYGAQPIGLDQSETMLQRAKQKYNNLEFHQADATDFNFDAFFDAVFSNSVLHWIPEQDKVITNIHKALKKNGRFIAEMGAKGNVRKIIESIQNAIQAANFKNVPLEEVFYFPSLGQYASLLEKNGFAVEAAFMFERPTSIENGKADFKDWVNIFGVLFFQHVPISKKPEIVDQAISKMLKELEKNERYYADYVRLRIVAKKL